MLAFLSKRPGPTGLGVLILVLLGVHAWLLAASPAPNYWGDEPMYAKNAAMDARAGDTSLLPGRLPFRTRPEFEARIFANFEQGDGLQRSATLFHMALLALTLCMVYAQARLLQVRPACALLAAGLLGVFPWFGFHVHSLWPEVLHACLAAAALLCILLAMRTERIRYLIPAGLSIGLALFTKGVLQPFALLFALVLLVHFWKAETREQSRAPWKRALLAPAVLLLSSLAITAPQLLANQAAGHGAKLAANRWWNLELGLSANPREGRSIARLQREYFEASPVDAVRESLARERTLQYLRERGLWSVFTGQLVKCKRLLFVHESSFERSLGDMRRWGPDPPAALGALAGLGRGMWFALLALGSIGSLCLWRQSRAWFLVSAFALCFFLAALLVPLKVRFMLPVFPILCLLSAGLVERAWDRLRARLSAA